MQFQYVPLFYKVASMKFNQFYRQHSADVAISFGFIFKSCCHSTLQNVSQLLHMA